MIIVSDILGHVSDTVFSDRPKDQIWIAAADAGRRRLRARSELGTDIGIDLKSPSWLADGLVLHDDGARILTVVRKPEPVMIVSLSGIDASEVFCIGHALGNRHAAVELRDGEIVVQVTETPQLAARPLLAYGIDPSRIRFVDDPFATRAPPLGAGLGRAHHHAHVGGRYLHES